MATPFEGELQLARRAAAGDEQAVDELYRRCAGPLYAFLYHHLNGSGADVEAVWQDTLLAGLRGIAAYRGECSLAAWWFGIARHKIADQYRRARLPAAAFSDLPDAALERLVEPAPPPEDALLARARRASVVEALAMLPLEQREVLVGRYVDGEGVPSLARRMGKSYKAVESLLSRARAALRETLQQVEREDEHG